MLENENANKYQVESFDAFRFDEYNDQIFI